MFLQLNKTPNKFIINMLEVNAIYIENSAWGLKPFLKITFKNDSEINIPCVSQEDAEEYLEEIACFLGPLNVISE